MTEQFSLGQGGETTKLRRTEDMSAADFIIASSQIEYIEEDQIDVLKTQQELLEEMWQGIQNRYWYMLPRYRQREPSEQWMLHIAGAEVPLYNYAPNSAITTEQVTHIAFNVARFASKFPSMNPQLRAITVIDGSYNDPLEDDMAVAYPEAGFIELGSYALEEGLYRPDLAVTRIDAVVIHELTHFFMDDMLRDEWEAAGFYWERIIGYSDKLQYRATEPEACVTEYAMHGGVYEDIAESVVAYMLGGSQLNDVKRDIIRQHESWLRIPTINFEKTQTITLPELPTEITYYIDHNLTDTELSEE